jgi:hypothetical protein
MRRRAGAGLPQVTSPEHTPTILLSRSGEMITILQKGAGTAFGVALPLGGPQNRKPRTF